MSLDISGIGTAATALKDILGMFFPDKTQEERNKMAAVMAVMQAQSDTNKVEAGSSSLFVAGWRPSVGWVCSISLGLMYIPKAIVMTAIWTKLAWAAAAVGGVLPVYPDLGVADLLGLLMALLGMAGLRSFDKKVGTS
jgi:hypothetical protein